MKSSERTSRAAGKLLRRRPSKLSPLALYQTMVALWRFLRDRDASMIGKVLVLTAIAYVVMPLDAVPDIAPVVGWLDDLGVAMVAMIYLSQVLGPYKEQSEADGDLHPASATVEIEHR